MIMWYYLELRRITVFQHFQHPAFQITEDMAAFHPQWRVIRWPCNCPTSHRRKPSPWDVHHRGKQQMHHLRETMLISLRTLADFWPVVKLKKRTNLRCTQMYYVFFLGGGQQAHCTTIALLPIDESWGILPYLSYTFGRRMHEFFPANVLLGEEGRTGQCW